MEHRGDFTRDSLQDVADLVLDSDPNAEAMVVWCAAPPCQDFSRIAQGAGHQGDRGRLFEESVAFMDEPRATAATGATGPGRGESLGGCSPYAAHAGRPADPGTGPDAVLEFRREWRHDLARIRRDVLARRHSRLVGLSARPREGHLRHQRQAPSLSACSACSEEWATLRPTTSARTWTWASTCWGRCVRRVGGGVALTNAMPARRGSTDFGVRTRPMWRGKPPGPGIRSTPGRCSTSWWPRLAWAGSWARARPPTIGTVALPSVADMGVLRQPPLGDCFAALSFAICQLKLGRGEDWRRSGHNATMGASDVPTHHFLGDIVDLVLRAWAEGWDPVVFGHDLQNAYRQWAVRHPGHCGTFLPSAAGVTLWFHFAMCFGAAASVWNFNRAADAVQMLLRSLLLVLLGHFVDDFNGVDSTDLADSAHHAVADFFALLGLQTKPSKAQACGSRSGAFYPPGGRGALAHGPANAEDPGADRRRAGQRQPLPRRGFTPGWSPDLSVPVHLRSDRAGGHQAAVQQGGRHGGQFRRHPLDWAAGRPEGAETPGGVA